MPAPRICAKDCRHAPSRSRRSAPQGGVLSVDKAANHAAYGEDTTPEKLLHGEVAAPTEFAPFYELLAELEAEEA